MPGVRNFADIPGEVRRRVDGGERVVLIFLDAFGLAFLGRHCDHPLIERLEVTPLSAQFPSTTTAHVTTAHFGVPLHEHGLYECVLLEQFRLTDFARKVVGVGSVGTRAWIGLLLGHNDNDVLFLQMKEAEASVLEEFLGPSEYSNHGQRVVVGQRLMQATSDIFLGWVHVESPMDGEGRDFYGRQLKDWKGSAEIDQMVPEGMAIYGRLCGWTLARAHARSGDRIAIAAYLGNGPTFDKALLEFSDAYGDQNERDYKRLVEAVKSGRIIAQTGL
jgi:hypothetical protein